MPTGREKMKAVKDTVLAKGKGTLDIDALLAEEEAEAAAELEKREAKRARLLAMKAAEEEKQAEAARKRQAEEEAAAITAKKRKAAAQGEGRGGKQTKTASPTGGEQEEVAAEVVKTGRGGQQKRGSGHASSSKTLEQLWGQKHDISTEGDAFLENLRDIVIVGQKRVLDEMAEIRRSYAAAEQERIKFETHVRHHILDKEVEKAKQPWHG
jgi:hypothetical protein